MSAELHTPATPTPVSADVVSPPPTDAVAGEQEAAVPATDEAQPTSDLSPTASVSEESGLVPSQAPECESAIVETPTTSPVTKTAVLEGEPTTPPASTGETLGVSDTPPNSGIANAPAISPPPNVEVDPEDREDQEPPLAESEPPPKPPIHIPPVPPSEERNTPGRRPPTPPSTPRAPAHLRLRVQLVFGRGGIVKTLALVADRREGMPSEVEVRGTQGELSLSELRNDCYEPVTLADVANTLQQGVEWRGRGDARRWRWVLGGREIYVLAPGDEFGLHGFVSTAGLLLNARQAVLAKAALRDQVLAALAAVGCADPELNDDTTMGVPSGWILYRDVIPTRWVPRRDEQDPLNVLCPKHKTEPHFTGGIRLKHRTWLVGYPPRIRFTGELGNGFRVTIDGHPAQPAPDGAFEAPGWDTEGKHRLWFGQQVRMYALHTMHEDWQHWHAHDFGTGAAICGASTQQMDGARWRQVRIPATNPLLVGARAGEIFYCQARHDVRSETILALVPFAPVWALPWDPVHADKRSARVLQLDSREPGCSEDQCNRKRDADRAFRRWIAAINDAGRKQLALAVESEDAKALWRRYRAMAKRLWRRAR